MAEASIPVDLRNPGQVFACLGLMEMAQVFCGQTETRFKPDEEIFEIRCLAADNPVRVALTFLAECTIVVEVPQGSTLRDGFKQPVVFNDRGESPARTPKADRLPVRLSDRRGRKLYISSWCDADAGRDLIKFWGGAAGFSAGARMAGQLAAIQGLSRSELDALVDDPFSFASFDAKTAFRLDRRSGYTALELGFSIDQHQNYKIPKYPFAEILATIGLENARPRRNDSRVSYSYGAWLNWLPLHLARPTLGLSALGFDVNSFTMTLAEPNDYDRVIVEVVSL